MNQPGTRTLRPAAWIVLAAALVAASRVASTAGPTNQHSTELAEAVNRLLTRPQLRAARVAAHIVRLSDGSTLYERDADRLMMPASNMKLFTTAAALRVLGPGYEFRTRIGLAGKDMVLVGGGDPSIGGRFSDGDTRAYFRRWAELLKQQGIRHVDGDLVLDDSFFDRQQLHPHWPKNDVGHWYAAPVAALALNDSCVDVRIAPAPALGKPARVTLEPPTRYFQLVNQTHTVARTKDHAPRVTRRAGSTVVHCDGGVYQHAEPLTAFVTVDDPVAYFGAVLREVLDEAGITIAGGTRRGAGAGGSAEFRALVVHRFAIAPVLTVTNKESQNFYAEQILKTIGAEQGDGSWAGGCRAVAAALGGLGVPAESYVLDDGSGLSPQNRATPRALTTLLAAMQQSPDADLFRDTLAVAGVDGTARKRLRQEDYRGRLHVKTGTVAGVRALSGYAETRCGEWLAFSLLINDARDSVRAIQDDFGKLLIDDVP